MNDCEFSYVFWLRNMALDLDEVDQVLVTWDWISSCNPEIETYEHLVIWSKICRLCMCACPCGRSSQERTRRDSWSVNMVPKSQQSSRFQLGFHLEWTVSMETPLLTNFFCSFLLLLFPAFSTPECTTSTTPGRSGMQRWSLWCVAFWSYSASLQLW